jgi:hypothetical protein
MKVYVQPQPHQSRGLARIGDAVARYVPAGVDVVTDDAQAELIVLHVIGRIGHVTRRIAQLKAEGRRYAIIQYALRSTKASHTRDWAPLWRDAAAVWCSYDLAAALEVDGFGAHDIRGMPFYYAPYGADDTIFTPQVQPHPRPFLACTTGFSWMTESVREVALAAQVRGGKVFHLGPDLGREWLTCAMNIDDQTLATYYRQCQWVSGLRRTEGFEMPAVEGLLCGARPILFDVPHYTHWYGSLARYVPERAFRADIVTDLIYVFGLRVPTVTTAERADAVKRFHWPTLVGQFWKQVLA